MTRAWFNAAPAAAMVAALSGGLAACGDATDTALTVLNLNRPVDIAFACRGNMRVTNGGTTALASEPVILTAEPEAVCGLQSPQMAPRDQSNNIAPVPPPPGQENLPDQVSLGKPVSYAFMLQSSTGTVAVASFPVQPSELYQGVGADGVVVLDADALTPGKNAISIGEDPVGIATDASGCYELTANAGSCDVSVLDVTSALAAADPPLDSNDHPILPSKPIQIDRRPVVNMAGQPITAKPAAMAGPPGTQVIGNVCPLNPSGTTAPTGVVYIAYPGCHVVAAVDMSDGVSGQVVGGIQFDPVTGAPSVLTGAALQNLSCPAECGGMPATSGVRPVALDLRYDDRVDSQKMAITEKLAIGAANSAVVTVVNLDPTTGLPVPGPVLQVNLEDKTGTLGVSAVALSPQIGMGGSDDTINDIGSPGGQGQYVYAVANDATVRVADILTLNSECDTQVDSRFARAITNTRQMQCFKVGDPTTPPRRSGARSPGIELIDDGVPVSVAIFKGLSKPRVNIPIDQTTLIGYFAFITSSSGRSFVVNVDDDAGPDLWSASNPIGSSPTLAMAHQLRDSYIDRSAEAFDTTNPLSPVPVCTTIDPAESAQAGGPRSSFTPERLIPAGTVSVDTAGEMPGILQYTCIGSDTSATGTPVAETLFPTPVDVRDAVYPDLRNALPETWAMTWEGPLSMYTIDPSTGISPFNSVNGPQVRAGQMVVDNTGMRIVDPSQPFCQMGVEPFDIVQFHGCNPGNGDGDCPTGYTCYIHPDSKVGGIGSCMLQSEATRLANACRDYLLTMRRFTVGRADSGDITMMPRQHELYMTPLDGCVSDQQCDALAKYAADNNATADRYLANQYQCLADPGRAPLNADPALNKRCVQTCAFHVSGTSNMNVPGYDGIDRDADCSVGTICLGATAATGGNPGTRGVCMEGVLPPQSCVNGPQTYDVRASEAFTVVGTVSGYVHPFIEQNGACVRDPAANRLQLGRVPLKAPACATPDQLVDGNTVNGIGGLTGELTAGGFEPNPCSMTVQHSELVPNYLPNTACTPDPQNPSVINTRTATAIKFANRAMTVHVVDPTYPGDMACIQDRKGAFDNVAMVVPGALPTDLGYQISFDQRAGYSPMQVPGINPIFPVKVVRGPGESLWVLDDGDSLTTVLGVPSTEGQVFRVESWDVNVFNLLQ